MRNRRGEAETLWIVARAVIIAVILLILVFILKDSFLNWVTGINSCQAKHGKCYASCGGLESIPAGDAGCEKEFKDQGLVCCRVEDEGPIGPGTQFGHGELIKVLIDKQKTPLYFGERRDLEIGKKYEINVIFDKKRLNEVIKGDVSCRFFLKDERTNEEFILKDGKLEPTEDDVKKHKDIIFGCEEEQTFSFYPTELQEGALYSLTFIIYNATFTPHVGPPAPGEVPLNTNTITDEKRWVDQFTAYLRVEPIIEISDISSFWVPSDNINVVANKPYTLSSVKVAIVPGNDDTDGIKPSEDKGLHGLIEEACAKAEANNEYKSSIHKITALKAGEEGLHIVFTLGRDAYQQLMYESQAQPITIINNRAKIHLDASSISETFDIKAMLVEEDFETSGKELKEHYLCVKATVLTSDGRTLTIPTYSLSPLRLDVAPPLIKNTDEYIGIVYPEPRLLESVLEELERTGRVSPEARLTPYYFKEYPKVLIKKCVDKSGCKNYNYYFAPTYIQINIHSGDLETGPVSVILGKGLNYLYNYLVTRNPLKTVCPLGNSPQYRYNTHPEMRFREHEQGVFCIKAIDGAGNYWLTWKAVYNPYDVLEELVANATGGVGAGSNVVVPDIGS